MSSNRDRHGQHRYGTLHKRVRRHFAQRMERGEVFACWRCGKPIRGAWDLGHVDDGRGVSGRWPEHRHARDCPAGGNRATLTHIVARHGSLAGAARPKLAKPPVPAPRSSREW